MIGNNHEIDRVRLRLCAVPASLDRALQRECLALLPVDEHERLRRLPRRRGLGFLLARALLREELSLTTGSVPGVIPLRYGVHGKPGLAGDALPFSLSYSPNWVLVAVGSPGGAALGVDVEEGARLRGDPLRLARRFFSDVEYEWLSRLREDSRVPAFLALWSLKEAWCKAHGKPLATSLPGPRFLGCGAADLLRCADRTEGQFATLRPTANASLAICRLGRQPLPVRLCIHEGLPLRPPQAGAELQTLARR